MSVTIERQFRLVERTDDAIRLEDADDSSRVVEALRQAVYLTIKARVRRICRSLAAGVPERWATLDVTQLILGNEDDFSELSSISLEYSAEDRILGVSEAGLSQLEVDIATVVHLPTRDWLAVPYLMMGGSDRGQHGDRSSAVLGPDDVRKASDPFAELYHYHWKDAAGGRSSVLVLSVGLPAAQFDGFMDTCSSGYADTLVLECRCQANSTGWAGESARDMLLAPGEAVRLNVQTATLSGQVPTSSSLDRVDESSARRQLVTPQQEAATPEVVTMPRGSNGLGTSLMIATVLLSLFAALLGSSAVGVLAIAVLGGCAALAATMMSAARMLASNPQSAKKGTSSELKDSR